MDPSAFFTLHDYDNSAAWTAADIRRTYGLDDESAKDITEEKKASVVKGVLDLFDKNGDGMVEKEEWMDGWLKDGKRLPDFGVGVTSPCGDSEALKQYTWLVNVLLPGPKQWEFLGTEEGRHLMAIAVIKVSFWLSSTYNSVLMYRWLLAHEAGWKNYAGGIMLSLFVRYIIMPVLPGVPSPDEC